MSGGAVGKNDFPLRQGGEDGGKGGISHQPGRDVDIVDIMEISFGINVEVADQPLQGDAILLPIVTAQGIDITDGDPDDLFHETVNTDIDQGEEIPFRGVEGVVEIEEEVVH